MELTNNQPFYKEAVQKKYPLKIDLQFFAEGDELPPGDETPPETITLTQEELNAKLQSESDRRVSDAIKKFEAKKDKEFAAKIELAKQEAEELAKLSADERAKVEREKEALKFQEEQKSFESERQAFQREKLLLETEKQLSAEKLAPEFASFVLGEDAEKTHENIKVFKDKFQQAVQAQVNDVLKGKAPLVGAGGKQLSEIDQLEKERQDCLKRRDMAGAIALKNKIHELQKQ
ncbi:DUF4355 domain-containing protein [Bacillus cereus]|uniref:DUF4355 domain-containing protein n=1 Tax=Bacillus cereus TaxID=1396 RepID=UPI0028531C77|nr:DUF4355 domain-containing protein [Bacillus cereus]MDR4987170.1 DUF4355 domain-containing protein [Bacillus cereus]